MDSRKTRPEAGRPDRTLRRQARQARTMGSIGWSQRKWQGEKYEIYLRRWVNTMQWLIGHEGDNVKNDTQMFGSHSWLGRNPPLLLLFLHNWYVLWFSAQQETLLLDQTYHSQPGSKSPPLGHTRGPHFSLSLPKPIRSKSYLYWPITAWGHMWPTCPSILHRSWKTQKSELWYLPLALQDLGHITQPLCACFLP